MAFFEDLGKKISDAGHGVTVQTKNFAEVARLNGTISDKEKKIKELYQTLGEAYYSRHKDDPSAEELPTIGEINGLFEEIEQAKSEIRKIKGIRICSGCGGEIAPGTVFCINCGTKVPEDETAEPASAGASEDPKRLCPNCGNAVNDGALFCNNCGTKIG